MTFEELDTVEDVFKTLEHNDEIVFENGRTRRNTHVVNIDTNEFYIGDPEEETILKLENESLTLIEVTSEGHEKLKNYLVPNTLINFDKQVWAGEDETLVQTLE